MKKQHVFEIEPKLWVITVTAPETSALFKVADYLTVSSRGPQAHKYSRLAIEAT